VVEDQRVKLPKPSGDLGTRMLGLIFREFMRTSQWPNFDTAAQLLLHEGIDVEAAAGQLSSDLLRGLDAFQQQPTNTCAELQVTLAGACYCDWSDIVLELALDLLWFACKVETAWPPGLMEHEQPAVTSEGFYLEKFGHFGLARAEQGDLVTAFSLALGDDEDRSHGKKSLDFIETAMRSAIYQVGVLLQAEIPGMSSIIRQEEKLAWRIGMDHRIREFRGVTSVQEWWARLLALKSPPNEAFVGSLSGDWDQPDPLAAKTSAVAPTQHLTLNCSLHPLINEVSAERFRKGLHLDAVLHAFRAVEHRVQVLSGSTKIGEDLMGFVLGSTSPRLTVTRSSAGALASEQAGMRDLFKGSMTALRNPRAHGPHYVDDPQEAQEMLVLASFLMRRLDVAEAAPSARGTAGSVAVP